MVKEMKKQNLFLLAAASLIVTGCSTMNSKYGCSGVPDGIVCKTPMQIYDQTNGDERIGVYQEDLEPTKKSKYSNDKPESQAERMVNVFSKPQFQAASSPMPILEQPKVMRIWVAPWKDENETLNWATYLFTEITPRKWNFGDSIMRNTPVTAPNKADYASPSQTVDKVQLEPMDADSQASKIAEKSNKQEQKIDYGSQLQE